MVENINWTDIVSSCVEMERNVLCTISRGKGNGIGRKWHRIYFLKQVIEGKIEREI